jgi:hypothetical protein
LAIVLTFGVNALWEKREEKRRTKEMLILVRNELVSNMKVFTVHEKSMKKDGYIYKMVLKAKDNLTSIPTDTLEAYYSKIQNISVIPISTSAWQIFQNSEMIQKMTNKELVIRLTDCYTAMIAWSEFISKDYWDTKKKMLLLDEDDSYKLFDAVLKNLEMRNFFSTFSVEQKSIWEAFFVIDAYIDYSIILLDKHGDFRYDMEEKDNEFQLFVNEKYIREIQKKDTINITEKNHEEKK